MLHLHVRKILGKFGCDIHRSIGIDRFQRCKAPLLILIEKLFADLDFGTGGFDTLDHLLQLLAVISHDVTHMARIRRGRYQVHHILFRILVVVGIAKDHIEELVHSLHILLAVPYPLLI